MHVSAARAGTDQLATATSSSNSDKQHCCAMWHPVLHSSRLTDHYMEPTVQVMQAATLSIA